MSGRGDITQQTDGAYSLVVSTAKTVGTAAVLLAQASRRRFLVLQNLSAGAVYIGGSGVTTANGIRLSGALPMAVPVVDGCAVYAISDTAAQDVRILEAY
jgi:hypothetical protein